MKYNIFNDGSELRGNDIGQDNTDYLMIAGSAIVLISFFGLLTALVYLIK